MEKLKEFTATKAALQKILKGLLHKEEKNYSETERLKQE
jgi:hypothetical protein